MKGGDVPREKNQPDQVSLNPYLEGKIEALRLLCVGALCEAAETNPGRLESIKHTIQLNAKVKQREEACFSTSGYREGFNSVLEKSFENLDDAIGQWRSILS